MKNEVDGACSMHGEIFGTCSAWVGKPVGKWPLGRPRRRWEDNITMDLQEWWGGGMDWIDPAQNRNRWWALVNAGINLRDTWNAGNILTSWTPLSFSRRNQLLGVGQSVHWSVNFLVSWNTKLSQSTNIFAFHIGFIFTSLFFV